MKTFNQCSISGNHLREFLRKTSTDEKELAALLNVNPASLKRWAAPSKDAPTSTTYLVLLPLLLGAGVDIIPESELEAIDAVLEDLGLQKDLKNPERKRILRQVVFARMNDDIKAARTLFLRLKQAWENIDRENKILVQRSQT
jgi:hypothetical protein